MARIAIYILLIVTLYVIAPFPSSWAWPVISLSALILFYIIASNYPLPEKGKLFGRGNERKKGGINV